MDNRNEKIINLYYSGLTMQNIAIKFKITRSRMQQIIYKKVGRKLLKELGLGNKILTEEEKKLLNHIVREEINKNLTQRKTDIDIQKKAIIKKKMKELPHFSNFKGIAPYAEALGESTQTIKSLFPDIAEYITTQAKKKWSWRYNKCVICGSTSHPHVSHGFCKKCYGKTKYFKEINEASRLRNKHRWAQKQKEYIREYNQRPEVIERKKRQLDERMYDGNRLKALKRDDYKCTVCGISEIDSRKKYGRDLYVGHIKDIDNHNLSNLKTLCKKCHNSRVMKIMRSKLPKNRKEK